MGSRSKLDAQECVLYINYHPAWNFGCIIIADGLVVQSKFI